MNQGIMGPRMYPYPIIPQEGGDGGGPINPNRFRRNLTSDV
jgi:hypothetical protein